jgi:hypothetical protein
VGVGFAMIPLNFWVGMAISAIAEVLLLVALFILIEKHNVRALSLAAAITSYVIIVWALWVPNSMTPLLAPSLGNYRKDEEIYGIKWQPNFSEITLVLDNNGDNDLTNLDIYVRTERVMHEGPVALYAVPGLRQLR